MIRQCLFFLLGLVFLGLGPTSAQAIVITPNSVTTSARSGWGGGNPNWNTVIENIIDGSGLSVPVTDPNFNYTTATHALGFSSSIQWVDVGVNSVDHVTFGFDSPVDLNQLLIWNYTQGSRLTNRGINTFDIQVDTGSGFSTVAAAGINRAPYSAFTMATAPRAMPARCSSTSLRVGRRRGCFATSTAFNSAIPTPTQSLPRTAGTASTPRPSPSRAPASCCFRPWPAACSRGGAGRGRLSFGVRRFIAAFWPLHNAPRRRAGRAVGEESGNEFPHSKGHGEGKRR